MKKEKISFSNDNNNGSHPTSVHQRQIQFNFQKNALRMT